jgi:hypothetical protein
MDYAQPIIPVVGILATFGLPLLLVVVILLYKHRRNQLQHETILKLAEKGLPVPPELLAMPQPRSGLRGGLVLVALGIALSVFFWQHGQGWSIGLIPGLMGVAMLIAWKIESANKDGNPPPR